MLSQTTSFGLPTSYTSFNSHSAAVENRLKDGAWPEGKGGAISIIQTRGDGHWGQGGSRGGDDRCLDSWCIFKVEPTGFADSSSEE